MLFVPHLSVLLQWPVLLGIMFCVAEREATAAEVNAVFKEASQHSKVLGYNTLPLVSSDFNHNPLSSIFDANHTKVSGKLLTVLAWYDNEWGFSNRMLDNCLALHNAE